MDIYAQPTFQILIYIYSINKKVTISFQSMFVRHFTLIFKKKKTEITLFKFFGLMYFKKGTTWRYKDKLDCMWYVIFKQQYRERFCFMNQSK